MKTISESDAAFQCEIEAPCFQFLSLEETELIRASKTQILFRKGENLTKQGTFSSYVLFLMDGLVKQYVEGEGVHNYNIRIIQSGEFLGLSSVFSKNTYNYSTIALMDTRVFLIEKEALIHVLKGNALFAFHIIKRYSEHNGGLFDSIRSLMFKQMNGRMAEVLLYLSSEEINNPDIFTYLSRKDLADFAGLSTETAVKLLKSFEKEGLIGLDEKNISIKDRVRLKEISKKG